MLLQGSPNIAVLEMKKKKKKLKKPLDKIKNLMYNKYIR